MKKLLNVTLTYYSVAAFALLILTAPLFYWLSEKLYLEDVDEAILLRKEEFVLQTLHTIDESQIEIWNRFNRDIQIIQDHDNQIKNVIFQKQFFNEFEQEWEPYRILYADVRISDQAYTLMIRLNLIESEDLVTTTAILYLIIFFVLISALLIISRLISARLWRPFYQTLDVIGHFDIESDHVPDFDSTNIEEFHNFQASLYGLIISNMKAYQVEKEFTQNASHEMQTPLAVFQSKLDLLLQEPNLTQSQAFMIDQLYTAASRLTRINRNLLLLAKIEHNQFALKENLIVPQLVSDVLPYFLEQAMDKRLDIQTMFEDRTEIFANKGLVEIMINNLILNAIKHNKEGGAVQLRMKGHIFSVINSGAHRELKRDKLFKRFSKDTEDQQGSGLGLAIVKKICELNNWSIVYHYEDGFHDFSIEF